jgi:hypothetical protein
MNGEWINYSRKTNQSIFFNAKAGSSYRFFENAGSPFIVLYGRWSVQV